MKAYFINAKEPKKRIRAMPAPTAASVKATSTASKQTNKEADNKLNIPVNIVVAKRLSCWLIAIAVITNKHKIIIFI